MNQKSGTSKDAADKLVKGIKRKTRKQYLAEEKIRIVLAGLRGEESIAALCRREGISESLYYTWSKEFLEAGKQRLAGGQGDRGPSGAAQAPERPSGDLARGQGAPVGSDSAEGGCSRPDPRKPPSQKNMIGPYRQNASHSPAG